MLLIKVAVAVVITPSQRTSFDVNGVHRPVEFKRAGGVVLVKLANCV